MADDPPEVERDELRHRLREESVDVEQTVAVRGGPDSIGKLRRHATRTHRAFVLDGEPIYGVSVFCALDDIGPGSLDNLLRYRLATYRWIHTPAARQLADAGFSLLATFARPHYTLLLDDLSDTTLARLETALGPPAKNPYHRGSRTRR